MSRQLPACELLAPDFEYWRDMMIIADKAYTKSTEEKKEDITEKRFTRKKPKEDLTPEEKKAKEDKLKNPDIC